MKRRPAARSVTSLYSSRIWLVAFISAVVPTNCAEVLMARSRRKRRFAHTAPARARGETLADHLHRFHRFCEIYRGEKMRRIISRSRARRSSSFVPST